MLAVITVSVNFDEDDGVSDGQRSVRDAILASTAGDTIDFDSSVPNIGTLNLTLGQIAFNHSLIIDASMLANGLNIHADTDSRVFEITDPTMGSEPPLVTLKKLTLTGGDPIGDGGAIRSDGRLELRDCVISGNTAANGGAVFVAVLGGGTSERTVLDVQNSRFVDNTVGFGGSGGAVCVPFALAM